jgi:hypothetical protein
VRAVVLTLLGFFVAAPSFAFAQVPSAALPAAPSAAVGLIDGRAAAQSVGTGGWTAGSFASGLFLGLIGTGVTYAIAASSDAELPVEYFATVQQKGAEYMMGFNQGYRQRVRSRRKSAALIGGLAGTAVGTAIVVALISASDDEYYPYYARIPVLQFSIATR